MPPCTTVTQSPEAIGVGAFVLCGLLILLGWLCRALMETTLERRAKEIAWDNIAAANQRAIDRNADSMRRQMSKHIERGTTVHPRHRQLDAEPTPSATLSREVNSA